MSTDKPDISIKVDNLSPEWGIMLTLQNAINVRIGTQSWKKYINAAFWNYISTPINFTITLFTALSAGQAGTNSNFLTQSQLFYILFVSFVLSVINTFFKLKDKAILNYDALKQYEVFGSEFEKIYYTSVDTDDDLKKKYNAYLELQEDINKYNTSGGIDNVNYATELIYYCFKHLFEDKMKRIPFRDRYWVLDGVPLERYPNSFPIDIENRFRQDFSKMESSKTAKRVIFNGVTGSAEAPENIKNEFTEGPEKIVENMDRADVNLSGQMVTKSPGASLISTLNIVKRPKTAKLAKPPPPAKPVADDKEETKYYMNARTERRPVDRSSAPETAYYLGARSRTPSPGTLQSAIPPRHIEPANRNIYHYSSNYERPLTPSSLPDPPNIINSPVSPSRSNSATIYPIARKPSNSTESETQKIYFKIHDVYSNTETPVYDRERAENLRMQFIYNMRTFQEGIMYSDLPIFKYVEPLVLQRYFGKYFSLLSPVRKYLDEYSQFNKNDFVQFLSRNTTSYNLDYILIDMIIGLSIDEVETNKIVFEVLCAHLNEFYQIAFDSVKCEKQNLSQTDEEREREIKFCKNWNTVDYFTDDELFDDFINIKHYGNDPLEKIYRSFNETIEVNDLLSITKYDFVELGNQLRDKKINYKYLHIFFIVNLGFNYFESIKMVYNLFSYSDPFEYDFKASDIYKIMINHDLRGLDDLIDQENRISTNLVKKYAEHKILSDHDKKFQFLPDVFDTSINPNYKTELIEFLSRENTNNEYTLLELAVDLNHYLRSYFQTFKFVRTYSHYLKSQGLSMSNIAPS